MMKKLLAILLATAMVMLLLPTAALAAVDDTFEVDGITYKVLTDPVGTTPGAVQVGDGTNVAITSPSGSLTIPSTANDGANDYTVTAIGDAAFRFCSGLTSVTIPDGVTAIGSYAFQSCSNLQSAAIPDGVTSIGISAFENCGSLQSVTIPDGVTVIGNRVFNGCSSLASVTIPDGVTTIEDNAFVGCTNLTSVTIPDGVNSIGASAFQGCTRLTSITIPDGMTSIREGAFWGCTGLTSVTVGSGVNSINYYAFADCGQLIELSFTGATPPTLYDATVFENVPTTGTLYYPVGAETEYSGFGPFSTRTAAYFVTATAGSGGSISPAGVNRYTDPDTQPTFTVTPDAGYAIDDVLVDGVSVASGTSLHSYTFDDFTTAGIGTRTIRADFRGFTLDPAGDKTFPAATVGYGAQSAQEFTVKNGGSVNIDDLTLTLSGAGTDAFSLSATAIGALAPGEKDSFSVTPATGLAAGTYTATVTVSGAALTSQDFDVSFTVNAQPPDPPEPYNPPTGESFAPGLWMCLALASIAGLVVLRRKAR